MAKKVLILGVNGFIGSTLIETILRDKDWDVYGMDLSSHNITDSLNHERFHFIEGDITVNKQWVREHVQSCDVVLPLVAIANPLLYVKQPLRVFELDFEANMEIIKMCVEYKTRIIFPSTSEVYGMSQDAEFDEETSNLVLGPIEKQRWIYSCAKQLIDRVIYAYGIHNDLDYTLFRPFNFLGPRLDSLEAAKKGEARVVTQFIADILYKGEVKVVGGGEQCRSFTDIRDGIDAIVRIIENKDGCASKRIFNVGNPQNEYSIRELAQTILDMMKADKRYAPIASQAKMNSVDPVEFYGKHYQDATKRVPSIKNAKTYLGWVPKYSLQDSLATILDYHAHAASLLLPTTDVA